MKPVHHPDLSTVLAYVSGSVAEGTSLVVAAHLEGCTACRAAVSDAETLAGGLLETLEPAELTENSLETAWKTVASRSDPECRRRPLNPPGDIPAVLAPYIPGGLKCIKWRALGPGIRQHRLSDLDRGKSSVRLLRLSPGCRIPRHTHQGAELTLILQGSYVDVTGRYRRGDLAEADHLLVHQPLVDSDEPCICITATDSNLVFTGPLNRILQRLTGI